MKKSFSLNVLRHTLAGLLLLPAFAAVQSWGQTTPYPPGQMSYQGFLVDANSIPLATNAPRNYDVIFTIYDAPTAGTLLWQELQTVTVDRGYFSVMLGMGSPGPANVYANNLTSLFAAANASDRFIGLTVKGLAPGADVEIQPRMRLLPAPYSFLAANAGALVDGNGNQVVKANGGAVNILGTVTAGGFSGSGAALTGIYSTNISGKIADSQLSANVAFLNANNVFPSLGVGTPAAFPVDVLAGQGVLRLSSSNNYYGSVLELKNTRVTGVGNSHMLGAINFTTGNSSSDVTYRGQIGYTDSADGTGYLTVNAGSAGTALAVNSSGNVGIGITSPGYKLTVLGQIYTVGNIFATGTITPNSDRNMKTDFAPVDTDAVLDAVGKMSIQEWRFKAENAGTRHMGPMAQDFQAAFGLGTMPTAIATVDADGVAFAAIQGLKHRTDEQATQLKAKEAELEALKQSVAELKEIVARLAPRSK